MLHILVYYDMQDDKERLRVSETCLDYGLDRQQYSVFSGCLTKRQQRALGRELEKIQQKAGYIVMIPIRESEWRQRIELGAALHGTQ